MSQSGHRSMARALAPAALVLLLATGCADPGAGTASPSPTAPAPPAASPNLGEPAPFEGPVVVLAKAAGWRDDLPSPGSPFALLEIAYDADTAARAWRENVPSGAARTAGDAADPADPGLFGDLETLDLGRRALVVWSAGESGTCPAWLADVETSAARRVRVTVVADAGPCTMDYRPYRMLLAVDRDRLPGPDELPMTDVDGVPDAEVRAYPAA
jgi:hypothetical protein